MSEKAYKVEIAIGVEFLEFMKVFDNVFVGVLAPTLQIPTI